MFYVTLPFLAVFCCYLLKVPVTSICFQKGDFLWYFAFLTGILMLLKLLKVTSVCFQKYAFLCVFRGGEDLRVVGEKDVVRPLIPEIVKITLIHEIQYINTPFLVSALRMP